MNAKITKKIDKKYLKNMAIISIKLTAKGSWISFQVNYLILHKNKNGFINAR